MYGEQIRKYRAKAGWTQEVLAEKLDISVNSVSAIERGDVYKRQNMGCRRIGKKLPVHNLFPVKAFIILRRRMQNAVMLRLIGLYDHLSRPGSPACPSRRLGQQLKGCLLYTSRCV